MGLRSQIPPLFQILIIASLLLGTVKSLPPVPKCQPKFFYRTLPMISNEKVILNLDNIFSGYNLNFSLEGTKEWENYITLSQKNRLLKMEAPDPPLAGLKSYHLEKIGNAWGNSFVALRERAGRTYLSYGFLASNTSAPVINNNVIVLENQTDTVCFDAVSLPSRNLIIIDCATKGPKNQQGYTYTNKFYYFNISDGRKHSQAQNQMFIPFENITRRKIQLYTERTSGNTYLIRSYMYDGVDEKYQNNTYIDVHMLTDPLRPQVVSVIDRSFLRNSVLRISDIRVYLSEIYILDYAKGIHRVRINSQEQLVYNGFYEARSFNRFSVYSNNLDDRFEVALANTHEVLEIDWTNIDDPILMTKYSLMPGSNVKQLFINERFVVVFAISVDNEKGTRREYNYTWVMSRGDRTYTKAFHVIKHGNANTFVDFNLDESYLMVIQDELISNYAIDEVIMTLTLKRDQDFLDRLMKFTIVANSTQPSSKQMVKCSLIFNFTLVEDNNRTMWPIGVEPSPYYHSNYPGKVVIPIYSYAIGPNITYRVTEVKKGQLKKYKIYQQDQLAILWEDSPPSIKDVQFLHTQALTLDNQEVIYIYIQDSTNITNLTACIPSPRDPQLRCNQSLILPVDGQINNWATISFVKRRTLHHYHIAVYTTTKHYNRVLIDDLLTQENILTMEMGKSFEGNVTHTQTYGKYLFIIRRYVKSIDVHLLDLLVEQKTAPLCSINHLTLYGLGIKYFSPELIETSAFYPNVLFIKTSDSIVVLDLNTECQPKLLAVVTPLTGGLAEFSFRLTLNHLIVIALPNEIIEYDLTRVFLKDIKLTKKYPIYGYKMPKNYDTDVSEYGNSIFVTTINEGGDYQVFVYRAGYPAVASLYDVIDLYTFEPILIDASGSLIDYVTVISGSELRVFREYETPFAEIFNPNEAYQFWFEYYNVMSSVKMELITVSIINLPTLIAVNPFLNDIMNTKDMLYSGLNRISEINDLSWYDGNVLTIKSDCADCDGTVIVRNHIYKEGEIHLIPNLVDYQWTSSGGTVQSYTTLLQLHHNGTIRDFIHLPQTSNSTCLSTSVPLNTKFQVSACAENLGINLYLVSLTSHKGFSFEPYSSKAAKLLKVQAVNELLILVDTEVDPFHKTRPGGIFLYAINFDLDENEAFEQIEFIDYSDFPTASDTPQYIVNADLNYHSQSNTYRLYVTEIVRGIYQFTFRYDREARAITILQSYFVDLPGLMSKSGAVPPYDATFQAVKVVESVYNTALEQSEDLVVVTTGVYYTVLMRFVFDGNHRLIGQTIRKFFLRYAYYVVENQIKYVNGFVVLRQTLPEDFENISDTYNLSKVKSKQLITLYDVNAMPFNPVPPDKIPEVGLIGAEMVMDKQPRSFDFNLTTNFSDPHPVPRINLVVLHEYSNTIDQMSLHKNLTIFTTDTVDTQIIYLDLINDFDLKKIRILLNGRSPFPQWKLITIILFSIIGFLLLVGGTVVGIKKLKAYLEQMKAQGEQPRESLMTEEKEDNQPSSPSPSFSSPYKQPPRQSFRESYRQSFKQTYKEPPKQSYKQPPRQSRKEQPSKEAYRQSYRQPPRQQPKQPSRQSYKQPVREPYKQPYKQSSRQPYRQSYKQPTRQPYRQSYKPPSKQSSKQPYRQPYKQPYKQPHRQFRQSFSSSGNNISYS